MINYLSYFFVETNEFTCLKNNLTKSHEHPAFELSHHGFFEFPEAASNLLEFRRSSWMATTLYSNQRAKRKKYTNLFLARVVLKVCSNFCSIGAISPQMNDLNYQSNPLKIKK